MKKTTRLFSLGVVLSLFGINIGSIIKVCFGTDLQIISVIMMLSAFFCMLFGCDSPYRKIPRPVTAMWLIIIYSLYAIIVAAVNKYGLTGYGGYGIAYQVFYLLEVCILWKNKDSLNEDYIEKLFFWIAGLCNIACLFQIVQRHLVTRSWFFTGLGVGENGKDIVTRANAGSMAYLLLAILLTRKKEKMNKLIYYIFGVSGVIVLILSNRRSEILAVIAAVILVKKDKKRKILKGKDVLLAILVGMILVVTYFMNAPFRLGIEYLMLTMINGIKTYVGLSNGDMAASARGNVLRTVPHEMLKDPSVIHFLFGRGYMAKWLDIPYLQAFYDLGIIGGILYIIIMGIIAVKLLLTRTNRENIKFAQLLLLEKVVQNFSNGCPYGVFFEMTMLLAFIESKNKVKREERNESIISGNGIVGASFDVS